MAWSLEKEQALREIVKQGVPYGSALVVLGPCETNEQLQAESDRLVREWAERRAS